MLAIGLFEPFAKLLAWFYSFTNDYILSISLIALIVMLITAPLVLKSTKGMLEMQKLQPQMRRLQNEHRGDRQTLNAEMMKLYQEHKVNPLASCLPLILQFPVFIIMYQVLQGLTNTDSSKGPGFQPEYLDTGSKLYGSLHNKTEMLSWGLDLARRPYEVLNDSFSKGLIYALLVVALGVLYFIQQKMVAARATVAPSMSPMQQKLMLYLPVVFAVFLFFYLTGLVIYYMAQAIFRIGLQAYITRKFYRGEESLGRLAIAAGNEAREINKKEGGGGGLFAQAKLAANNKNAPAKGQPAKSVSSGSSSAGVSKASNGKGGGTGASNNGGANKRVTPPKGRPTSGARPASTGRANRPGGGTRPPKKK